MAGNNEQDLKQFLKVLDCEKNSLFKVEKLHSFTTEFLSKELTVEIYLKFITDAVSQVPFIFEDTIALINKIEQKGNAIDDIQNKLLIAGLCLETLSCSLNYENIPEEILSFFVLCLRTLHSSYLHCKDSEAIYGDQLEKLVEKLAIFFKQIQNLEQAIFKAMDNLQVLSPKSELSTISLLLGQLGRMLFEIDNMMAFNFWKMYIKILTKYKKFLKEDFEVDSNLEFLATEVLQFLKSCLFVDDEDKESSLKVCSFQMNIIIRILEQCYDSAERSIPHLSELSLNLFSILIRCYSRTQEETSDLKLIQNFVSKATLLLISVLKKNNCFNNFVFNSTLTGDQSYSNLSVFMLKLTCLFPFEESSMNLNHYFVLQSCFISLQENSTVENMMLVSIKMPISVLNPAEVFSEEKDGFISIYNYAFSQLSAFWKICPEFIMEDRVDSLLQLLVSSSDIASLLLCDVWMHRLRCTSVEFLCSYYLRISQEYKKMESSFKIENFLKRILKFLPFCEKEKVLEVSIQKSLNLYGSKHRSNIPQLLPSQDMTLDDCQQVSLLIDELKQGLFNSTEELSHKGSDFLVLGSFFVDILPSSDIIKLLDVAKLMLKSEEYSMQMAVLTFLKAFSKKHFAQNDIHVRRILESLSSLLAETLQSQNYIVKCRAFNVLTELAHQTPHIEILQGTFKIVPHLMPAIKSSFTMVPLSGFLTEEERLKLSLELIPSFP